MEQIVEPSQAAPAKGRTPPRMMAISLPNLLTYARILAVPAMVLCLLLVEGPAQHWGAFAIFASASVTDWLDGYLARIWEQQSSLGRMLDPIADKLLVGAALLMLVYDHTIHGISVIAALVILCREILVSGLREYLAELNVKIHVTWLAKWKTFVQMVALGVLLVAPALASSIPALMPVGLSLLWIAAVLTLWTGYDYVKAGVRHAMEQ
jgi:CDP-diacylglycerol--glycerol-3-phosphate 3-phosphatidyltransferase/cardiolipin synthase